MYYFGWGYGVPRQDESSVGMERGELEASSLLAQATGGSPASPGVAPAGGRCMK